MTHTSEQILMKARALAKKIVNLSKKNDIACSHEIDLMVQDAQYVLLDTQHLEILDHGSRAKTLETLEKGKETLRTLDGTLYARGET